METSLHKQLKARLTSSAAEHEVRLGRYRIDAVDGDELVEIQHGKLLVIRDKIADLLKKHRVRVVKPIVARKTLLKYEEKGGPLVSRRQSPKRSGIVDLVHELVYFTRVFPHPRLVLEVPLVEVEEHRIPMPPRRRRWRRKDYIMLDQCLVEVVDVRRFQTSGDLLALIPAKLAEPFTTAQIAEAIDKPRWVAQRLAYCLKKCGAIRESGKIRHAMSYVRAVAKTKAKRKRSTA